MLLSVSGAIEVTNAGDAAVFDRAMLEDLGLAEVVTRTMWTEGPIRFEGPTLAAVLDRVGATGVALEAEALNDYIARIPMDSVEPGAPIIALRRDGAAMSVRRKGPLWIIYPFDSGAAYKTDAVAARAVWQLRAIRVLE